MVRIRHLLSRLVSRQSRVRQHLHVQKRLYNRLIKCVWILFFCILFGIPAFIFLVIENPRNWFGGMPALSAIENPENDYSSELISSDGVSLGRFYRYHRSQVAYHQLAPVLVNTLLISEDHRFYQHSGLDFWSYLRVVWGLATFNPQGGGSTLSQQTAKNLFQTRGNELKGKLAYWGKPFELLIGKTKEWIIAVRLEKNLTKEEIITLYLNTVPFNNNAFGIRVAAETYFNKPPSALTINEAALLVGMLQGTSLFNPVKFPERALRKRNDVLVKLFSHKYIQSKTELDSLCALPLQLNLRIQNYDQGLATYFRGIVQSEMAKWASNKGYDIYESGLKIYTTIDSRLQRLAEEAAEEHMRELQKDFDGAWRGRNPWVNESGNEIKDFLQRKIKRTPYYQKLQAKYKSHPDSIDILIHTKKPMRIFTYKGDRDTLFSMIDSLQYYNKFLQTGLLAMHPKTGEIKAWVGGVNYKYFKFDHVRQAKRQPGSTFKPFVYSKAMEDGYSPCQEFRDIAPTITINGLPYEVKNFNGTHGDGTPYTLRQALAKSLNTITMQLMLQLKPENIAAYAYRVGIESKLDAVYALGLGTSDVSLEELVGAYCTFANAGIHTKPYYITRIEDKHGNVIENFVPKTKQVIDEVTAYKTIYLLKGAVEEEGGSLRAVKFSLLDNNEMAGKTGTTNDASDGWFIGLTHNLVTGVWVGGDERSIHFPNWTMGSGARSALPLWLKFMEKVYQQYPQQFPKGYFKQPDKMDMHLSCENHDND